MTENGEAGKPDDAPVPDELITLLVPDPAHIPNLIVLVGLLGLNAVMDDGNFDGKLRLYLTPTLNDYITFDQADLVHREPPPEGSPLAGSTIWLKRTAIVQRTRIESHQMQAEFLQGNMTGEAPPSMPGLPGWSGADGNLWTMVNCPPSIWRC